MCTIGSDATKDQVDRGAFAKDQEDRSTAEKDRNDRSAATTKDQED